MCVCVCGGDGFFSLVFNFLNRSQILNMYNASKWTTAAQVRDSVRFSVGFSVKSTSFHFCSFKDIEVILSLFH